MTADYALLIDAQIVMWTYFTYIIWAGIGTWIGIGLYLIWRG